MPTGKITKALFEIYYIDPRTQNNLAKHLFDKPEDEHLFTENETQKQVSAIIEQLKKEGYIEKSPADKDQEIPELTDKGLEIINQFNLTRFSLTGLFLREVLHLIPDTEFIVHELTPVACDLLYKWLDEHDGNFPNRKEERKLLKTFKEKVTGKKFRLRYKVDMSISGLAGRKIKTDDDIIWLFARQVTYDNKQVSDFEELYEQRRNIRIGQKKLAFRGIGVNENDEPVILTLKKNGEHQIVPVTELTDKEKDRLITEIIRLADAINENVLLICASVWEDFETKYDVVDVIFHIDWDENPRKTFLYNAAYQDTDFYAKGTTIKYNGTDYVISMFSRTKGNYTIYAYPENKSEEQLEEINALDLEEKEFDKIVKAIEKGHEDERLETIFRPRPKSKQPKTKSNG